MKMKRNDKEAFLAGAADYANLDEYTRLWWLDKPQQVLHYFSARVKTLDAEVAHLRKENQRLREALSMTLEEDFLAHDKVGSDS